MELSSDSPPNVREAEAGLPSRRAAASSKDHATGDCQARGLAAAEAQPLRIWDSERDGGDSPMSGHGEARGRCWGPTAKRDEG